MLNNNSTNKRLNSEQIRVLGGVLLFLGIILSGSMGAIMMWMNNAINNPLSTTKFNGTPAEQQIIFGVLGMVAFFGITATVTGAWQVLTGRRSKFLIFVMLGLGVVLFFLAKIIPIIF